jgi:glycosyltransferase involved in cell wall biosynthesis
MTQGLAGGIGALRIAHLIESDGPGGAERVLAQLATALQQAGARNVVCLPANGEGWLAAELEGSGVAIEHFTIDRPFSPRSARQLRDAFRRHRITLAHSHEFSMAVYGAWASWRAGVPHVITMHGGRYYSEKLRRRLAMRAAIAASRAIVAVSEPLAHAISSDLGVRRSSVVVLPNGVRYTEPARTTLRSELALAADDRLIVAVGNLYPVKGHVHAIDALALLVERHPSVHLAISGRGQLERTLLARARQHGLARRVHLLGLRADIPAVLGAADVFVMPSLSEGLPLALLEAMFSGCPIVATDVGQVRTALAHGTAGILVEPGNSAALAEALDRLLSDPAEGRRLGLLAASHAASEYSLSRMVQRYLGVYTTALGQPQRAHGRAVASAGTPTRHLICPP